MGMRAKAWPYGKRIGGSHCRLQARLPAWSHSNDQGRGENGGESM